MSEKPYDLKRIGESFELAGQYLGAQPYGNGHINDTFLATYSKDGTEARYIHQRINHNVFKNPVALMENVARVTEQQRQKIAEEGLADGGRRALTTISSSDQLPYHRDDLGNVWRTYHFIENARSFDAVENESQAGQAARAFGIFQRHLADLPGKRLNETIPNFHHTPKRFQTLVEAVESDPLGRVGTARAEVDFVMARAGMMGRLIDEQEAGRLPERITHNDTKLNNVLLDTATMEGLCVIDLDTVMPGLALYDFGDMVRTSTSPVAEDELNLSRVQMQMPMFSALVDGYLSATHDFLTPAEKSHLVFSGRLITLEIGLRFLTDFLQGDKYFRIHRAEHNLDRSRTQFALVASMERQQEAMERVVAEWSPSRSQIER